MSDTTIPAGFVRIQDASGKREFLVLSTRDFNSAVHKLYDEPAAGKAPAPPPPGAPPAPPAGSGADTTPGGIATVNSEAALELIAKVEKVEDLDALEKAERASEKHPAGRKGVLGAIAERRKELAG